jgi:ABC-type oligopeptide transport system ATPase subunit
MKTTTDVLRVEDLKTWFPVRRGLLQRVHAHVKAVDGVSFTVAPGETLCLVGESGCGKSTVGKTVLRLLEPTGGRIWLGDTEVTGLTESQMHSHRRQLQMVFQDPYASLNPRMRVGDIIAEPLENYGLAGSASERRQRLESLLDRVGLRPDALDRFPFEFSGGQRQRLGIARALALNPGLIVADEPVSALDVSVQAQVLNLLVQLRDEFNLTYIFISHDLSVVKFISDRIAVMNAGKIVEMGSAAEIYQNPQQEYTRSLIEAIPMGTVQEIRDRMKERGVA